MKIERDIRVDWNKVKTEESINSKWIMFFQTPYDRVKYLLEGMDKPASLPYKKFKYFLFRNFKINDRINCLKCLDSFETVFIDNETGQFSKEYFGDVTPPNLIDLMKQNYFKPPQTLLDDTRSRMKNEINSVFKKIGNIFNGRNRDTTNTRKDIVRRGGTNFYSR